jgi:cysteine desulfurase
MAPNVKIKCYNFCLMGKMSTVYLDYAATTPVDPIVLDAMMPYFTDFFGNPSSIHRYGQKADAALENAREVMAGCFHCSPRQVFFTSGGTESDNLAIRGGALWAREKNGANQILITPVEHPAVISTAMDLQRHYGFEVIFIPVDSAGMVLIPELKKIINKKTAIVSVIYANNEIGTINPIPEISSICRENAVIFHTDGVQAAGLLDTDVETLGADLISIGAHKFYGPKGIGALFIRKTAHMLSIQTGGSQEWALRAGTQNIPLIVGLAKAFELAVQNRLERNSQNTKFRDQIIENIVSKIPAAQLTGHRHQRLSNHASFVIPDTDGNQLVMMLDHVGFACSSGSACKTGSPKPSEVLLAIGIDGKLASGSLRVTIGKDTRQVEIDQFLLVLPEIVKQASV